MATADEPIAAPTTMVSSKRLVPQKQPEADKQSQDIQDGKAGLTPADVVTTDFPPGLECSPTPFLDTMTGIKGWLAHRFEFPMLRGWAGADDVLLAGDVEDPYWLNMHLLWGWFRDTNTPALLTTSTPQSSSGIIGQPGTRVLFGGGDVDLQTHVGSKLTFGFWLEPSQAWGFETSYFFFGARTNGVQIGSRGDLLLASPFFNALNNENDSVLIANLASTDPERDLLRGQAEVLVDSRFQGLEVNAVNNSFRGPRGRLDWAWGYRYLRLDEGIHNNLLKVSPPAAGQQFGQASLSEDLFGTENSFHGFSVGLRSRWWSGCWSFDVSGKLGMGLTRGTVDIFGRTIFVPPTGPATIQSGGIYALANNIGNPTEVRFSVVPEIELGVGYHFWDHWRLGLNYNLLVWTNVVRPGDQIDPRINPNQFPPVSAGGPLLPERLNSTSTFWMNGLALVLEFRW